MMFFLQAFLRYIHNVPSHIISTDKVLPYYSIRLEHTVTDSQELKIGVPEHVVPKILETGSKTDRIKQSSLHFYQQGGVDGIQVNES